MVKKNNKVPILLALSLSIGLLTMPSTITLVHLTNAQTNKTSSATAGNNTAMMQNNSNSGNPNATTLQGIENKSKESTQPIIGNISQGGKAIGSKAGELAQSIVNETGKVFSGITGALNKSSNTGGK